MTRPASRPATRSLPCALAVTVLALVPLSGADAQSKPAGRILGVFDELTFQPLEGAVVTDLGTGTRALTTATGTISLAYLGSGTTILQIRKVGYAGRMLPVTVSPADTVSITVVLTPLTQTLPAVVTSARQPADTVRKLEMNGFYERMHNGAAPASAYVTAEQLAKWNMSLLSDLKNHAGRGVCGDIYIDGEKMQMLPMARVSPAAGAIPYRQGIDELVNPSDVAGIEIYTPTEAPARYWQPQKVRGARGSLAAPGGQRCAVTLIWLK